MTVSRKAKRQTILVVEDEADVREFASRVLELEGYRVLHAQDGDSGLKLARKRRVALVLLDLGLPGRDGWSVLAEMKSEVELSAVPVVVFTASAEAAARERAMNLGARCYLIKPLSAARLRETVAQVVGTEG